MNGQRQVIHIYNGIGLCGVTFLVLLTLKLCGATDLSWFWVTIPLWGLTALIIAILIVVMVVGLVAEWLSR